ncbi:hypothetical protein ZWY2020_055203 [Hordeum vulgare]|nr:hypothetical protein ZWY2020_055203 [Hordeum vulgare]
MARLDHTMSFLLICSFILSITNPSFSCPVPCETELTLRFYLRRVVAGPSRDQEQIVASPYPKGFGQIVVNDWSILDAPESNATIIARGEGMQLQASRAGNRWFNYVSIVFKEDRFRGSTLIAMGITQWAIVGGTGQFASAHGTIKLGIFRETNVETYVQLDIHVFSTPETVTSASTADE